MRAEFTKQTKLAAWDRSGQRCECYKLKKPTCNRQKIIGIPEYHHLVPAALGGSNDLDNCAVLSAKCHGLETRQETVPEVAKTRRIYEKRAGVRKSKRPMRKAPKNYDTFNRCWRDE